MHVGARLIRRAAARQTSSRHFALRPGARWTLKPTTVVRLAEHFLGDRYDDFLRNFWWHPGVRGDRIYHRPFLSRRAASRIWPSRQFYSRPRWVSCADSQRGLAAADACCRCTDIRRRSSASSLARSTICSRTRIAQISFCFNGDFCPTDFPFFHGTLRRQLLSWSVFHPRKDVAWMPFPPLFDSQ